ncbi:MAG: hypothetical protein AABO41_23425 [Acidobacteriota bacterium]
MPTIPGHIDGVYQELLNAFPAAFTRLSVSIGQPFTAGSPLDQVAASPFQRAFNRSLAQRLQG